MRYAFLLALLGCIAITAAPAFAQQEVFSTSLNNYMAAEDTGTTSDACASCETLGDCCCNKRCGGRLFFSMAYLYWNATRDATPFAGTLYRPSGTAGGLPIDTDSSYYSELQNTKYRLNSGFRANIGYQMSDRWDIGFRYTYFSTNGSLSLGDPTVDSNAYIANRLDRGLADDVLNYAFDDGEADYALQSLSLKLNVYDIELRRALRIDSKRLAVRVMGGFRIAEIGQTSHIRYQNLEGETLLTADTDETMGMTAAGLLAGGEADYLVGWGTSIFARGAVSLLFADFNATRVDLQTGTTRAGLRSVSNDFQNVVPTLELDVGIRWQRDRFYVAAGYDVANWFNMVQGMDVAFQDDVDGSTNGYTVNRGDLGFNGFFAEAGFMF